MFELLEETYRVTEAELANLVFNKGSAHHRLIMALYCTIIEQTKSATYLYGSGHHAGIEIILRSSLEAHADLLNLLNDEGYSARMEAAFHEQMRKLAKAAIVGDNPFLEGIREQAAEDLAHHEGELQRLGQPLSVFRRFEMAGLAHVYRAVYNDLCNHAHNNIGALTDRHFRRTAEGDDPQWEITIFNQMDEVSSDAALDSFISILNGSNCAVHHFLDSPALPKMEELLARRQAMGGTPVPIQT